MSKRQIYLGFLYGLCLAQGLLGIAAYFFGNSANVHHTDALITHVSLPFMVLLFHYMDRHA